jgi:serine/threonine protein kinase/tetratricopeptide (TPR) repeat protein
MENDPCDRAAAVMITWFAATRVWSQRDFLSAEEDRIPRGRYLASIATSSGQRPGGYLSFEPRSGRNTETEDPVPVSCVETQIAQALASRYGVEREIGSGGMALVYLADDLKHHRKVALKVLRSELAESIGVERFLREIRIEASLQHANIIPVFDSGNAGGLPYYVMPYIDGKSLRDQLTRELQLSLNDALRVVGEVGAGLSCAHDQGIIHRDIKPENILLAGERAMIADFGIARLTADVTDEQLTTMGIVLGTPAYMSPEQASASDKIDIRTDVYSLGAVLYEMLAGEPPFTGRTRSAVIAKIITQNVPSLSVVRPNIPSGIERAVEKALAKVPADRYGSVHEMVEALDRARNTRPNAQLARGRKTLGSLALAGALAIAGVMVWNPGNRPLPVNDNRIVVFPLSEAGTAPLSEGTGEMVALGIGSALEETAPLQWEDGWLSLSAQQRADIAGVPNRVKNEIARAGRARYRLDGSILATEDSGSVILWLYDITSESVVGRQTEAGRAAEASPMRLAIRGVRELLPSLIKAGRDVQRIPLEDRNLGAVVLWMQGKREYRASRFLSALSFYIRAIERDSSLSMAALNGAQAASWLGSFQQAERLVGVAISGDSLLPEPHAHLAKGLHAFLTGQADTAVVWLERALQGNPQWPEAHMALAEVFHHLIPSGDSPLDSLAESEFVAASADSNFSPPLFHAAELAIRRGQVDRASVLVNRYGRFAPDGALFTVLNFMLECVRDGAEAMSWQKAVTEEGLEALAAAKSLSAAGMQLDCAERGFKAVMRDSSVSHLHWGSILGLQGILLARGQYQEFANLIDSVMTYRRATMTLYVLGAIADSQLTSRALEAEEFVRQRFGHNYERSPDAQLSWTMGAWHGHRGDTEVLRAVRESLAGQPESRQAALFAAGLTGQLRLLEGSPARAIQMLYSLGSTARRDSLEWQPGESLPSEHLLLARLLFDAGRFDEATQVASVFDHPAPIIYLAYLPASLLLRYRAAQALGKSRLAARYRERLLQLGRTDLLHEAER